jgi:glycosyltransferase involved in cell wall biosynthesis
VIGLAAALSRLEDGDEEYLFLANAGGDEWLAPYVSGPCRILHTRRSRPNRRGRAVVRAGLERLPGIGLRFVVRPSDGTAERAGADVIHFPFQDAFTTAVPSIYQPHDLQHLHLPELFPRWIRERREVIYRAHCERAETVVSMTSWGRDDLIERYRLPPEKVAVVPGGSILPDYPEPSPAEVQALAERIGFPGGFLLYPAQTWPHKNHARLIEALALIRDRDGAAPALVCCGRQTAEFPQVEARVRDLGLEESVKFLGFVSPLELRALYELATGLVFPSLFEGWGLPVCEAFSAGVPVAASSATSLPDLVGDAGVLFDPTDIGEMAAAISSLWGEPELRDELARRGTERAGRFTFDHAARLFRAHYRQVGARSLSEEDRILLAEPPPA